MPATVAIVGRPNVGKSALFNRLAGRRISIVHDQPGVTRDRISGTCNRGRAPFDMLDTGGIGSDVDTSFTEQVRAEVEIALVASDLLLFVVDGQQGLSPIDQEIARHLRRIDKPLILVVNKIDDDKHFSNFADFTRLGFPASVSVSAEHNRGIDGLIAQIEARLPVDEEREKAEAAVVKRPVKIAVVGRPNVGKSSLTNALLGDERTLVSDISGTTRDAVDIPYERHGNSYVLIDTAGIRARGKVDNVVEIFSVMRSESSIKRSDLCILVIDATVGVTAQDKKIAGIIQEARRPCVVAVNKWDLIKERTETKEKLGEVLQEMRSELFFLDYAPLLLVSAKTKAEFTRLFKTIEKVRAGSQQRIGTGPLNRLLQTAMSAHPPGSRSGKRFKMLYGTQPECDPGEPIPIPEFVFFVNDEKLLAPTYIKYLENQIREHTPYDGLPLTFRFRARQPDGRDRSHGSQKGKPAEATEESRTAAPRARTRRPEPRSPKHGGRKKSRSV